MERKKEGKKRNTGKGKLSSSIFINLEESKDDSILSTYSTDTIKSINNEKDKDSEKYDSSRNDFHSINDEEFSSKLSSVTIFTYPTNIVTCCVSGLSSYLFDLLENALFNFLNKAYQIKYPLTIYHILSKSWINLKIVKNKLKFQVDQQSFIEEVKRICFLCKIDPSYCIEYSPKYFKIVENLFSNKKNQVIKLSKSNIEEVAFKSVCVLMNEIYDINWEFILYNCYEKIQKINKVNIIKFKNEVSNKFPLKFKNLIVLLNYFHFRNNSILRMSDNQILAYLNTTTLYYKAFNFKPWAINKICDSIEFLALLCETQNFKNWENQEIKDSNCETFSRCQKNIGKVIKLFEYLGIRIYERLIENAQILLSVTMLDPWIISPLIKFQQKSEFVNYFLYTKNKIRGLYEFTTQTLYVFVENFISTSDIKTIFHSYVELYRKKGGIYVVYQIKDEIVNADWRGIIDLISEKAKDCIGYGNPTEIDSDLYLKVLRQIDQVD